MKYNFFGGNNLMKTKIEGLRSKYMNDPPEGMTVMDIRNMSDDDLLDMDYFLNDDDLDDDFGEEGFYIF
jgi:hypothetical protein